VTAATFNTGWLVALVFVVAAAIVNGALYVCEARGQRRADQLSRNRRRMYPLIGLIAIACVRTFVFKG
jgi:hypothetical protein